MRFLLKIAIHYVLFTSTFFIGLTDTASAKTAKISPPLQSIEVYVTRLGIPFNDERKIIISDTTLTPDEKSARLAALRGRLLTTFRNARTREYGNQRASAYDEHSCTKGTSGGQKDCGCKYIRRPDPTFTTDLAHTSTSWDRYGVTINPNDYSVAMCLKKSGKGTIRVGWTAQYWRTNQAIRDLVAADELKFMRRIEDERPDD